MRKPNPFRDELKVARSQRKRLQTIVDKLSDMSAEWADWHGDLRLTFTCWLSLSIRSLPCSMSR